MLYFGDCLNFIESLEDNQIDTTLTDPPYGMSFQSNRSKSGPIHGKIAGDDKVNPDFLYPLLHKTKPGGCLLIFSDWKNSCEWAYHINNAGWQLKSQVIWDRLHHGMGDLKGAFAPQHDIIYYATKGRRIFTNGRPRSIKRHQRPNPSQNNGHPTCKPVALLEELLLDTCDGTMGTVFDPFMGSGSTGVAAKKLGRNFIGCEVVAEYFDTAERRVNEP